MAVGGVGSSYFVIFGIFLFEKASWTKERACVSAPHAVYPLPKTKQKTSGMNSP
jgi:hypothetical protein